MSYIYGAPILDVSRSHNDAAQSVGLLWTSDQLVAETSTWQHTTLTTEKYPCPRWDSNPRSQQVSGRRPWAAAVLPTVVRRCVWSRNLKNEEAMTRVGSQRHRKKSGICNYIAYFLLGISPASTYNMPTFRNHVSVPSSKAGSRLCGVRKGEAWFSVLPGSLFYTYLTL